MNLPCKEAWLRGCQQALVALITLLLFNCNCFAQLERYELGKRLRRFEQAWQTASDEQRKPSAAIMQEAVRNFFSLNLLGAAQKLDEAWLVTRDQPDDGWMQAVAAFRLKTSKRLLDENAESLSVSLDRFYKTNYALAPDLTANWTISDSTGKPLISLDATWAECVEGVQMNIKELPAGDHHLTCTVNRGDKKFVLPEMLLSKLNDLSNNLSKLEAAVKSDASPLDATIRASIKDHLSLLTTIQNGTTPESDFPAYRILSADLKLISAEPNANTTRQLVSDFASQADQWLTLTNGKRKVPVRLRSPERTTADKLPVLFLFHGAGGSENMFFETYGAGQAVVEGLKRGWLVVASRQSLMGLGLNCKEMLDDLERFFNIDREQVYLVGHSMGAAQVIRQATLQPELPKAAAVIGGGSATRDAKTLSKIAWYVSAGQLDFGKSGAVSFHQSLRKGEVPTAKYEEFANIEHMVIVQAALPSLFAFFDEQNSVKN